MTQTEGWPGVLPRADDLGGVGTDTAAQQDDLPAGQSPAGVVIPGPAQLVWLLQPASCLRAVLGAVEVCLLGQFADSTAGQQSIEGVIPGLLGQ